MEVTFENSGEKEKGCVVWNILADGISIGHMYRDYAPVLELTRTALERFGEALCAIARDDDNWQE